MTSTGEWGGQGTEGPRGQGVERGPGRRPLRSNLSPRTQINDVIKESKTCTPSEVKTTNSPSRNGPESRTEEECTEEQQKPRRSRPSVGEVVSATVGSRENERKQTYRNGVQGPNQLICKGLQDIYSGLVCTREINKMRMRLLEQN